LAMSKKACSTFVEFLDDVSTKGTLSSSANCCRRRDRTRQQKGRERSSPAISSPKEKSI
jgi:hypothetical protein